MWEAMKLLLRCATRKKASGLFPCHYRILEWVGFKETLKIILFHPPLPQAGTLSTRSGCTKLHPIHPWTFPRLRYSQSSLSNTFQCCTTFTIKKLLFIPYKNLASISFCLCMLAQVTLPFSALQHFVLLDTSLLLAGSAVLLMTKNCLFTHRNLSKRNSQEGDLDKFCSLFYPSIHP